MGEGVPRLRRFREHPRGRGVHPPDPDARRTADVEDHRRRRAREDHKREQNAQHWHKPRDRPEEVHRPIPDEEGGSRRRRHEIEVFEHRVRVDVLQRIEQEVQTEQTESREIDHNIVIEERGERGHDHRERRERKQLHAERDGEILPDRDPIGGEREGGQGLDDIVR